jgi:hypothetical protein
MTNTRDSSELLVRVDRSTGRRAVLSDFTDPINGYVFRPDGVAVEEAGHIMVLGYLFVEMVPYAYAFFRVDPVSGVRTILSLEGLADRFITDFVVDSSENILAADNPTAPVPGGPSQLLRIHPVSGSSTLISELHGCGGYLDPLLQLDLEPTGDIVAVAGDADSGTHLLRVDSATGSCTAGPQILLPNAVAVVPTLLVNGIVSLSVEGTELEPPTGTPSGDPLAPAGVFRITAAFTNGSAIPIRNPFFRVAELTSGNVLVSEDRSDPIRAGGKGTRQTPDVGSDGVLSPGESVIVQFGIGLQTRQLFTFLVNVFGESLGAEQ